MKKFFNKFRRWLIVKLGGYTEQYLSPYDSHVVIEESCNIDYFGYDFLYKNPEYESIHKKNLAYKLTDKLYDEGYITFKEDKLYRYSDNAKIIVASIKVARKCNTNENKF